MRLTDHERKILRILFNTTGFHAHKPLSMELLEIKTGYSRDNIRKALTGLAAQRYIEWPGERIADIRVIEGWERGTGDLKPAKTQPTQPNYDIWTY